MTNTEKPTTKAESKKQNFIKKSKVENQKSVNQAPIKKEDKPTEENIQKEETIDKKKDKKAQEKPKKTEAWVRGENLPISTKTSSAVCKFIKGKKLGDAIRDLSAVSNLKKAVPVKGEHPHRKGKIMSGKYPIKVSKNFIVLLKSLASNASDIDEPIIVEAFANIGARPYGRFGRVKRKRTHITIKVKDLKKIKKNKSKKRTKK